MHRLSACGTIIGCDCPHDRGKAFFLLYQDVIRTPRQASTTLSTTTEALYERAASRPALAMGFSNRERVLLFPGGFPLLDDGICIAGLGVSGAKDEEDVEIATSIIEKNGFSWQASR